MAELQQSTRDKTTPAIETHGLTKFYGKVRGIEDVDLEVRVGEVFGFLGPNGAGKTTTLRMLSTMLKPTAGDASLCGFSVTKNAQQVRQRIGFLSAATSLYGRLTAREMVTYFGRLNRMPADRIKARIAELFELFDM